MKRIALSKLPKGEYVRFTSNGSVWVKGDYLPSERKYSLTKAEDMNHEGFRKGSFTVLSGFDY